MTDDRYKRVVYKTGEVRYKGLYLDGTYTRAMASAIKKEAEDILGFFERTDAALKASIKEEKNGG